jgi:hypothetical protein
MRDEVRYRRPSNHEGVLAIAAASLCIARYARFSRKLIASPD